MRFNKAIAMTKRGGFYSTERHTESLADNEFVLLPPYVLIKNKETENRY